ncbi:MAG: hypothetical protein ACAI38_10430 [Myxococcota bacterium]
MEVARSAAVWARLPAEVVRTELPANVPAALSAGWQSELRRIGVPGDPRVLDRYVADHRPALD